MDSLPQHNTDLLKCNCPEAESKVSQTIPDLFTHHN
jgi:hypothetical protein